MKTRGRPVLGAISGFFLGLFLALDLLFFGVVQLDNMILTILPIAGLVLGVALALWAPLGRGRLATAAPAPSTPAPTTVTPPPATPPPPEAAAAGDEPA